MTRLTLPIGLAGAAVAKLAGDFEAAMNTVEAKSGATGESLAALREKAIQLGTDTQFSASEAAGGMIELAKAGLNAGQIMNTISPALDFAAASGMSLAEVSKILADTMAQFSLDADSAVSIADALTKGADSATTDVGELAEALSWAGTTANTVGMELDETTAILTAMASTGIKASRAGTGLSNALIKLAKPTSAGRAAFDKLGISLGDYVDQTGKLRRPFADLIRDLNKQGASISDVIDIFDVRAGRALAGLINDTSKLDAATAAIAQKTGNAAKQAAVQMKGFNGALKALRSALEGLAIRIAESGFLEWISNVVMAVTQFIRGLANLNPSILKFGTILAGILAGVGVLVFAIAGLSLAFSTAAAAASAMWLSISWPIVGIVAAVLAAIAVIVLAVDDVLAWINGRPSLIGEFLGDFETTKQAFLQTVESIWNDLMGFADWVAGIGITMWDNWITGFDIIKQKLTEVWESVSGVVGTIGKFLGIGDSEANINTSNVSTIAGGIAPGISMGMGAVSSGQVGSSQRAAIANSNSSSTSNTANNNQTKTVNMSPTINVNVAGSASRGDAESIAERVRDEFARITEAAEQGSRPAFAQ
jgi:TP901 family phage tail tape measure protein